jgi:hypothetical protein
MAKYKSYNYKQTSLVSVDLEKQLSPGTIEFAIHYLVDNEMDLIVATDKKSPEKPVKFSPGNY